MATKGPLINTRRGEGSPSHPTVPWCIKFVNYIVTVAVLSISQVKPGVVGN